MKIAVHITFFFVESRLRYFQQVVENFEQLPHQVYFFIYTNEEFEIPLHAKNIQCKVYGYKKWGLFGYNGGIWGKLGLTAVVHPYYLTWENRKIVEETINDFDVQVYIEDDIAFDINTLNYWIDNKDICLSNQYNLGFLRIEFDNDSQAYFTDLVSWPQNTIEIDGQFFLVNDVNPYCGFWIEVS